MQYINGNYNRSRYYMWTSNAFVSAVMVSVSFVRSAGTFLFHKDECRFGLSDTDIRQRHYPHVSLVPNGVGRCRLCQILHLRSLRSSVAMQWNVHEPSRKLHFVVVVQIHTFNILLP